MKSAFCPVIRNNSPPARRQHIAKVCCFPIGTRLNSRQSRKPTARKAESPPLTGTGNRPPHKAESPRPSSEAVPCPLPEPETHPSSEPVSCPYQSRKPARPLPEPETRAPLRKPVRPLPEPENPLRKPFPVPYRSRKPAPLFGNPLSSFWFPRQSRKTI